MRLTINEREKGYIEELIWDDFKKVANLANEKDIIKADCIFRAHPGSSSILVELTSKI